MIPVVWRRRVLFFMRRCKFALRFGRKPITIDSSSWVSRRSDIRNRDGGTIEIGKNCEIHPYAMVLTYGGDIRIGDNCSLNPFAIIYGYGGVRLGNGVRVAAHTVIIASNHLISSDGKPFYQSGVTGRGISIEDNVWLGAGVVILDGVTVGRNSIVAAGSVVTKPVPANTTVAGVPARVIATR
ncbi:MAG TPA: acyltransferase [Steroidobacteraceae bacterium]|nr:acyltransferase [Steroidobacteraceae bacterium]